MPIEQMNISLPPKMARFIRAKVKAGQYTNASDVVRDAVRHMQEADVIRQERLSSDDLEAQFTPKQRDGILKSIRAGREDIDRGDYTEYVGREGLEKLREKMKNTVRSAAKSVKRR